MDTMLCDIVDADEVLNLMSQVAPGENNTARSLFTDPNVEELSFPTLFGGYARDMGDPDDRLSMNDVFKYELYNMDRRFANHIPNLFFKTRMKMAHEVNNSANARLRMGKLG